MLIVARHAADTLNRRAHCSVAASELCFCACRALTNRASLDKELPDELFCHLQGTQHA